MYEVILHKNAAKYYGNADKKLQERIAKAMERDHRFRFDQKQLPLKGLRRCNDG